MSACKQPTQHFSTRKLVRGLLKLFLGTVSFILTQMESQLGIHICYIHKQCLYNISLPNQAYIHFIMQIFSPFVY